MRRIGIIGAGAVAGFHAQAAAAVDGLVLAAVCDLRAPAAEAVAGRHGAAVFTDYRELLDSGEVDAVVVNTPHALHREMVLEAAARGLHVLVEKPMATTLDACDEMASACRVAGVTLAVGQIQHFLPEKVAVARALAAGTLGPVQLIHDYRSTDYRPGSRSAWFLDPVMAGGGALMNIGAHLLDRSIWLGGAPVVSVRASTLHRFGSPVETDGTIALTLANGVSVSISVVSDTPHYVDELMVVCEHGTLTADPARGTFLRRDGVTTRLHENGDDDEVLQEAFLNQMQDFARTLDGGQGSVPTTHARHVVEVILAAYESAAAGATVELSGSGGPGA
ncbi:MAG TPA: Gfo/Idh/MocA family oxidoreductase [Micrococcaceae bacterium]|nr:Gfo/Idh/MocA family oxidoreductase [Micrococcaceae bacterium]